MIISNLVLTSIYATGQDGRIPPERFFQFRAVGMGIFLGTFLLLWTPLIVWKMMVSTMPFHLRFDVDIETFDV